ncbi:MAG TPA: HlyD family efflux transporter periplasmic adaptor subunit [Gemmataceae bacterium]|nr:HlyD family efflux transporter periplasmic adaptor subunit [Gemmataceae bacterium]
MWLRNVLMAGLLLILGGAAALAAALVFPEWLDHTRTWLKLEVAEKKEEEKKDLPPDDEIELTESLKNNLGLSLESLVSQDEYVRTVAVPGVVVERPGNCEHLVTAPLAGVIKNIHLTPHDRVAPGKPLFTMQIVSETLQTGQANYFKTKRDLELKKLQVQQLEKPYKDGVIPPARMLELEQDLQRLETSLDSICHELRMRGLTNDQITKAGKGDFLKEITIMAPDPVPNHDVDHGIVLEANGDKHDPKQPFFYEMEELKTLVGEYVQAGQTLCRLADHKTLFIEGRVFANEAALVQKAAKEGLKIKAEFHGDGQPLVEELRLRFFANKIDPETQTLQFYVLLPNTFEELTHSGKIFQLWQYRPGQRVRLHVPVDSLKKVVVVPSDAVVHEGPEAFVFRVGSSQRVVNGEKKEVKILERYPVHVLHEDSRECVLAFEKKMNGRRIAMNGAVQLNWVLKAQKAGGD